MNCIKNCPCGGYGVIKSLSVPGGKETICCHACGAVTTNSRLYHKEGCPNAEVTPGNVTQSDIKNFTELYDAALTILEWLPLGSPGSSIYERRERLRKALRTVEAKVVSERTGT